MDLDGNRAVTINELTKFIWGDDGWKSIHGLEGRALETGGQAAEAVLQAEAQADAQAEQEEPQEVGTQNARLRESAAHQAVLRREAAEREAVESGKWCARGVRAKALDAGMRVGVVEEDPDHDGEVRRGARARVALGRLRRAPHLIDCDALFR